jgi:hypothetical protein
MQNGYGKTAWIVDAPDMATVFPSNPAAFARPALALGVSL